MMTMISQKLHDEQTSKGNAAFTPAQQVARNKLRWCKRGIRASNRWLLMIPTHRSRDTAHAHRPKAVSLRPS